MLWQGGGSVSVRRMSALAAAKGTGWGALSVIAAVYNNVDLMRVQPQRALWQSDASLRCEPQTNRGKLCKLIIDDIVEI